MKPCYVKFPLERKPKKVELSKTDDLIISPFFGFVLFCFAFFFYSLASTEIMA